MPRPPASRTARIAWRILVATGLLALTVPLLCALAVLPLLLLGVVDVEATIQRWIRPQPAALGLQVSWDEPEGGSFTVTNLGTSPARGLRIRLVEDYTYANGGIDESELWLGNVAPGEQRIVGYGAGQAERHADVGALRVWLTCDRGTAFAYATWSWAF
jgi:hypothetical protein